MAESTPSDTSIKLKAIPVSVRRQIASNKIINLAEIARATPSARTGEPVGRDMVYRVLIGEAKSERIALAIERALADAGYRYQRPIRRAS